MSADPSTATVFASTVAQRLYIEHRPVDGFYGHGYTSPREQARRCTCGVLLESWDETMAGYTPVFEEAYDLHLAYVLLDTAYDGQVLNDVRAEAVKDVGRAILAEERIVGLALGDDPSDPYLNGRSAGLERAREIAEAQDPGR